MTGIPKTLIFIFAIILISCNNTKEPKTNEAEPADPVGINLPEWASTEPGLHSGFGSTNIRYDKNTPPDGIKGTGISLSAWKGEKINSQIVLWASSEEGEVNITVDTISSSPEISGCDIRIRTVKYVLTDEFLNGCGYRDTDTIPAHLSPDMLDDVSTFRMEGFETRPVWISISVPQTLAAGDYKLVINACTQTDSLQHLVNLEVQDRILPEPEEWAFHLDIRQDPFAVARLHNVQPWSQEHIELLRPLLKMLAQAGQKCITAIITAEQWEGQTNDTFESMITWIRNSDGLWEYDYSVFDQYVRLAVDCGIDRQINCYSMIPSGNKYRWFEEDSARFITVEASPGSAVYKKIWRSFLNDFRVHLTEMGWIDKVTIALDEREEDDIQELLSFIKESAPDYRLSIVADNQVNPNYKIYDLSYSLNVITDNSGKIIPARKENGSITTFYVNCNISEPNTFTFSPPSESAYLAWLSAAMGLDGFRKWTYNNWPEDPVRDSRSFSRPAGDTYLVYPGARSSVRLEKMAEGIRDCEKMRILKADLAMNPSMEAADAEKRIGEFMKVVTVSSLKDMPASYIIGQGRKMIEEISRIN